MGRTQGAGTTATPAQPEWVEPELATLTRDRFSSDEWLYERKFDGERCLAYRFGGQVQLMTRNRQQVNSTYPELDEALRIIGSVWQQDTFEWHGKLLDIEPPQGKYFRVLPRPLQRPHPPLYLACTKRDTVRLAAEYGVGALVMGFGGVEEVRAYRKIYDEAAVTTRTAETQVSTEINHTLVALCPTIVLEDADLARKIGMRGQQFFSESIAYWYGGGDPPSLELDYDNIEENLKRRRDTHIARLQEQNIPITPETGAAFNVNHAYGSPQRAIEYVEQLRDAGADEIMCLVQMGTVPQSACMETLRHWGEKVIPHFRRD